MKSLGTITTEKANIDLIGVVKGLVSEGEKVEKLIRNPTSLQLAYVQKNSKGYVKQQKRILMDWHLQGMKRITLQGYPGLARLLSHHHPISWPYLLLKRKIYGSLL